MDEMPFNGDGQAPSATGLRILIVDDYPDCAESLALLLRIYGHDTLIAHCGKSALEAVEAHHPAVVLLDIGLHDGMDGWEVAKRLRRQPDHENRLLIAITGYGQESDRLRSAESGIALHLIKPIDLEQLRAVLTQFQAIIAK